MKNTTTHSQIVALYDKCYDIFEQHGGYNYNDKMLYQLQGLRESHEECINDEDLLNVLKDAKTTHKWFKHIEKIRVLEESEPESLFC